MHLAMRGWPAALAALTLIACGLRVEGAGEPGLGTEDAAPPSVALVGGTLINPNQPPVPDATVVVRGGRVVCAGPRTECSVPEGVEVVDVRGTYVGPGLIDAHAHYSQSGWVDSRPDVVDLSTRFAHDSTIAAMERNPRPIDRAFLCAGVTSVLDAGGYTWTLPLARAHETALDAPRVMAAGPILLTRDSRLNQWLNLPTLPMFVVMTDDSVTRASVRANIAMGAHFIKIGYLSAADSAHARPLIDIAAKEARASGIPLIAHVQHLAGAKHVVHAGVRVLVHVVAPEALDEEFLTIARQSGVIVVPTLTVFEGYSDIFAGRSPADRYPLECVDPVMRTRLEGPLPDSLREAGLSRVAIYDSLVAAGVRNVRRLRDAGVPMAVGTDAGNPGTAHGASFYREMELLQSAGMTPAEIFSAATIGGARAMGRETELGSLEPGKVADLVVFDVDPTISVDNARRVRMVMRGGALYRRAGLLPR